MERPIEIGKESIKKRRLLGESGFTLLELLAVLSIISLLASIAVPMYQRSVTRAREAVLMEDLYQMRDAIDKYYVDRNEYPLDITVLVDLKYLRGIPVDPLTGTTDEWTFVNAENGIGIFDIHSGSSDTGRNGIPYSEW